MKLSALSVFSRIRRREKSSRRMRRRRVRGNSPVSRSDIGIRLPLSRCRVAMSPAKPPVRCPWSLKGNDLYVSYHDTEWGVPAWDDQTQFEFLILEGAQAGLS